MTREQIEKAAKENASTHFGLVNKEWWARKNGFEDGAQWRINSVWYDAGEKPDKNRLVVFEWRKTYGKRHSVDFGEVYESIKNIIVRWAYIIDLLPERKEETE